MWHVEICAGSGMLGSGINVAMGGRVRTVAYVERESYAAACLVARMADKTLDIAPVWDDVNTATCAAFTKRLRWYHPLILSGGYPCQPFSCAGKRAGENDERHLWPGIARLIGAVKPEVCFFENVPGHLTLGFDTVCGDLERMGYRVAAGLFSAEEVGASHKRERLFILADAERESGGAEQFTVKGVGPGCGAGNGSVFGAAGPGLADAAWRGQCGRGVSVRRGGSRKTERCIGESGKKLAESAGAGLEEWGCECGDFGEEFEAVGGSDLPLFAPGPGYVEGWRDILNAAPHIAPATERELCRTPDGLAYRLDTDRLRLTGNGVVPLAAAYAFVSLWAALEAG